MRPTMKEISKEALAALPIKRYEGPVVLVDFQKISRLKEDLEKETIVGFDTETRPAFKPGQSYLPSLVQLATARAVYLFQVQQHDFSAVLREIFSVERITKAGVSVDDDLKNLRKLFEFQSNNVQDLGKIAKQHGMKQTGVRNLAGILLGARIPKGAKTTNWASRTLTPQQITYAATDAWACRVLFLRFRELGLV
jgi:ribonuclease D